MVGLLGKKVGMTQVTNPSGHFWPVTVIQVDPATITEIIQKEKQGYSGYQIASGEVSEKRLNKPRKGFFAKAKITPRRHLKEFRVENPDELKAIEVGKELKVDLFEEGDFVDVHGTTIGKGFQGVIKRWGMSRGPETHGGMSHRRIGSIGQSSNPSRVWRGLHMPGHMGNRKRTTQNLLVVKILKDENLLLVKGAIPGHKNGMVSITKSFKRGKINIDEVYKPPAVSAKKEAKKTAKKK